ncbi:hypothetical protein EPN54_06510 [bacterium]|nr:MAG: hypothetical protein EPN54_06510 [bacterium]
MAPIKFNELLFDHIVEFTKDHTIFAAAKNGDGHLRLFLINEISGHVYTRNGRADSWEELFGTDISTVIGCIAAARNRHIPVYRINGTNGERPQ